MKKLYLMPRLSVVFFVTLLPVIILSSIGFRVSLEDKLSVNRVHNLRLELNTSNFQISVNNSPLENGQSDIFLPTNQLQNISLASKNYKTENFQIFGSAKTATKISNLSLLPNKEYATMTAKNSILLDKTRLLVQKEGTLEINEFNINAQIIGKFPVSTTWSGDIGSLEMTKINPQFFLDRTNQLAIYFKNGWKLESLKSLGFKDFIHKSEQDLFFMDNQSNLGIYNLETQSILFLDKKATSFANSTNSNFTTIHYENTISQLNNLDLTTTTILQNPKLNQVPKIFEVIPTRQYNFVRFDNWGFLVDNLGHTQTISDNLQKFTIYDDLIIWVDDQFALKSYNFNTQKQTNLNTLPTAKILGIKYNFNLSRIFIYTDNGVLSSWFGKNLNNTDIVNYSIVNWILGQKCQLEMEGDIQICKDKQKNDEKIYFYDSSN